MSKVFYIGEAQIAAYDRGEYVSPDVYAVLRWCNPSGIGDRIEVILVSSSTPTSTRSWFLYLDQHAGYQFNQIVRDIEKGEVGHWKSYFQADKPVGSMHPLGCVFFLVCFFLGMLSLFIWIGD